MHAWWRKTEQFRGNVRGYMERGRSKREKDILAKYDSRAYILVGTVGAADKQPTLFYWISMKF